MLKTFINASAFVAIVAASLLIYIHYSPLKITIERPGEVKVDREQLAAPTPKNTFPDLSQLAAPVIVVPAANPNGQAAVTFDEPSQQAAVENVAERPAPVPLPKARPKAKKRTAATKLKTQWKAPEAKPFSLGDLFNVR